MLPKIGGFKIITVTNLTSAKTIITTKTSIKSHISSIKISFIKKTHLILIHSLTFKTTNLIKYPVAFEIKEPLEITNFLTVKNYSTEIKGNYETKIIKSLTLKALPK